MVFIDNDTLEAIRLLWQTNPALPTILVEPVQAGKAKAPQGETYAITTSERSRDREWKTAHVFYDYRNVKLTVYGTKPNVTKAVIAALTTFNRDTILVYPSGARFQAWVPLDEKLIEADSTRHGQDVWQGIIEAEVWSTQNAGAAAKTGV